MHGVISLLDAPSCDKTLYAIFHFSLSDGNIPRDSTYVLYEEESIPTWLFATMSSCAALGIAMAIGFFLFNVKHRNNR